LKEQLRSETRTLIREEPDIVSARSAVRDLAAQLGFSNVYLTMIATAVSELARNILQYARTGEIRARVVQNCSVPGIEIVASDSGPGIADVEKALQDGYSTSGGLGIGLPGVRRLMDEFEISAASGTTVTARLWQRKR